MGEESDSGSGYVEEQKLVIRKEEVKRTAGSLPQ
jgi:hypothetical protein